MHPRAAVPRPQTWRTGMVQGDRIGSTIEFERDTRLRTRAMTQAYVTPTWPLPRRVRHPLLCPTSPQTGALHRSAGTDQRTSSGLAVRVTPQAIATADDPAAASPRPRSPSRQGGAGRSPPHRDEPTLVSQAASADNTPHSSSFGTSHAATSGEGGETRQLQDSAEGPQVPPALHTTEDFIDAMAEASAEDAPIVVLFHAGYCRACGVVMPKFAKLAREFSDRDTGCSNSSDSPNDSDQLRGVDADASSGATLRETISETDENSVLPSATAQQHRLRNMRFATVQLEKARELSMRLGVRQIPVVHIYDGEYGKIDDFPCGPSSVQKLRDTVRDIATASS